ncbi:Filamin-C [Larimichthys crocea]|uniref:Filamin-C n=1 Tax=Larimichthys crocea TaxID=215358 RepID=A0A6G0HPK7_LARCR|nr:Filamin-C [Larimichthys crocea]
MSGGPQQRGARRGGGGDAGHREGPGREDARRGRGREIQQNTFTRWCNEHLKCVNKRIVDLQKDLSDGLKLIGLLEVLSQKKMYRKYHSRPNFRQMKLENVSVALEFLEREHIKLVSIDVKERDEDRCEGEEMRTDVKERDEDRCEGEEMRTDVKERDEDRCEGEEMRTDVKERR